MVWLEVQSSRLPFQVSFFGCSKTTLSKCSISILHPQGLISQMQTIAGTGVPSAHWRWTSKKKSALFYTAWRRLQQETLILQIHQIMVWKIEAIPQSTTHVASFSSFKILQCWQRSLLHSITMVHMEMGSQDLPTHAKKGTTQMYCHGFYTHPPKQPGKDSPSPSLTVQPQFIY